MLFYVFLGPTFLIASSVFSLVQIETKYARTPMPSQTFTNDTVIDVIRNISRVNNALQELIKNYEKLQKIYKTESFESGDDYSTDSEIDERYRNEKRKKKNRATTDKPLIGFPATQFIAFEDTVESSATDDESVNETKSEGFSSDTTNQNRLPTIQNLQAQSSPSKNEIKSDSTESSMSEEMFIKEKDPMTTTSTKKPHIIFIDTHKLLNNISKSNRPLANVEPIRSHEHDTTPKQKTRYKKVDHRSDLRSGFHNDISLSINVNSMPKTNGSKMVVHKETFSRENMWDEISRDNTHKIQDDAYFRTKTNKENEVIGSNPRIEKSARNGPKDSEPPSFNKAARIGYQDTTNKGIDSDSDSAAEEKEMNKEIFKTHVLRQAYGDSCTKLVVRNCFKACKAAVQRACVGSTCKSSFKTSFQNHSRTGCIKQFDTSASQVKHHSVPLRTGAISFPNEDYWTAACWPLLSTEGSAVPKSKLNSTSLKPEEELNILRNRYEKACQSAMAAKCNTACMYSYEAACKSAECPRKRENHFKKHCKRECKNIFKRNTKDSESETETETESETESTESSSESTVSTESASTS